MWENLGRAFLVRPASPFAAEHHRSRRAITGVENKCVKFHSISSNPGIGTISDKIATREKNKRDREAGDEEGEETHPHIFEFFCPLSPSYIEQVEILMRLHDVPKKGNTKQSLKNLILNRKPQ